MEQSNIRNFCVLSHIDHGKSTLADRFLEITGTVNPRKMQPQYLDRMALERERGITIKMQPVRMIYHPQTLNSKSQILNKPKIQNSKNQKGLGFSASDLGFAGSEFILNLIDTPGHVDFSYEVSRSLAAVEGAVLLVDATQGIQAQTLTNLELANRQGLTIIPVINKIDLSTADIEKTKQEITNLLNVNEDEILLISSKTGKNIEKVLERIINKVPAPLSSTDGSKTRSLIFDSEYDSYKGVIAYVRIFDGQIKKGDKIYLMQSGVKSEAIEVGYFNPDLKPSNELKAGEIGYIATGLKDIEKCRVGDTLTMQNAKCKMQNLPGYKEPQSVVFASFYPSSSSGQVQKDDYDLLKDALRKLKLNDASLSFFPEASKALGRGFKCGFLGMLHLEIISERLKRDYNLDLVITSPSVVYRQGKEPWIEIEIITPERYLGQINKLLSNFSGDFKDTNWLTKDKIIVKYQGPLNTILKGFYDKLKNVSSGYASMSYKLIGYRDADLVKLDIFINKEPIEAFSKTVRRDEAYKEGKKIVELLKKELPSYQWAVPIQAAIASGPVGPKAQRGWKIIARETKKAMRKDVTAPLYGGDYTRKKKLLEKQRKGKKKLAQFGKITIPSEVFLKILKETR